jgi:uncharacterized protein with PQ loop repeat
MLLFLIFFPRNGQSALGEEEEEESKTPTWKEAVLVLALSLVFIFIAIFGSVLFAYPLNSHIRQWANFLGVLATLFAAVQYLPQIYTTYRIQSVESLSVPMMCIQTPGSFVFAASLAARLGPQGWSAWGLFILTGCMQGVLLGMSLWFLWRDRRVQKVGESGAANAGASERTPLLRNEDAAR